MFGDFPDIAINRSTIAALCSRVLVEPTERSIPCWRAKALARLTEVSEALKANDKASLFLAWQCVSPVNCLASRKTLWEASHNVFRWIKQHLRVTSFWGNTENAVRIQIYVAVITYCLVAIVEHDCELKRTTFNVLRVVSRVLTDKTPIRDLFNGPEKLPDVFDQPVQLEFAFKY